jgi:AcrR family transcriptional regulator
MLIDVRDRMSEILSVAALLTTPVPRYNVVIVEYDVISRQLVSYPTIKQTSKEAVRRTILDAAIRVLLEEGIAGLNMRRIASDVGCSTTVIYTMFGGKAGLVDALWVEGFERLWQAEEAVDTAADPLTRLGALGSAYRANALANPDYYRLMFGSAVPGFRPSPEASERSRRTFQVLIEAVDDCISTGMFRPNDSELVASILWATVHGVVSLEIGDSLPADRADERFVTAMRAIAAGFMVTPSGPS